VYHWSGIAEILERALDSGAAGAPYAGPHRRRGGGLCDAPRHVGGAASGIVGSTLSVIPNARHLTPLECPERIIADLQKLLEMAPAE
jgi:pimeloyl-ACP methyl ester carboxylesterase